MFINNFKKMNSPKTLNGITRKLEKQAFNGAVQDFIFESQEKLFLSEFYKNARPLIMEILDSFKNDPVKICSTIKNENGDGDTIYATKIEEYNLDNFITSLLTKYSKILSKYKFYLNITKYDPNLEFMDISDPDSDDEEEYCELYDICTLNQRSWSDNDIILY